MGQEVEKTRQQGGRTPAPSYAIIDSQSVKTVYKGEERSFDRNKIPQATTSSYDIIKKFQ